MYIVIFLVVELQVPKSQILGTMEKIGKFSFFLIFIAIRSRSQSLVLYYFSEKKHFYFWSRHLTSTNLLNIVELGTSEDYVANATSQQLHLLRSIINQSKAARLNRMENQFFIPNFISRFILALGWKFHLIFCPGPILC